MTVVGNNGDILKLAKDEGLEKTEITGKTGRKLTYNSASKWEPPYSWLAGLSIKYPRLTFSMKFEEPLNCYRGMYSIKAGEMIRDLREEYSM
jgi:hypothetical protein